MLGQRFHHLLEVISFASSILQSNPLCMNGNNDVILQCEGKEYLQKAENIPIKLITFFPFNSPQNFVTKKIYTPEMRKQRLLQIKNNC